MFIKLIRKIIRGREARKGADLSFFREQWCKTSKRRIPPPKRKYEVPEGDYQLLRFIRQSFAAGERVILTPDQDRQWQFYNAKILNEYYGFNQQQVLELTGFWVG